MPVFGTMASRFNDDGVTALYQALLPRLAALGLKTGEGRLPKVATRHSTHQVPIVPGARVRYLADIADIVRGYKQRALAQARLAREIQQLRAAAAMLTAGKPDKPRAAEAAVNLAEQREAQLDPQARKLLAMWPDMKKAYAGDEYVVKIRDREIRTALTHTTLSGSKIRKVALPPYECHGELLKWLLLDNVPGSFPYTAGTFAFKRENEDPTRMFAGEGDAFRTNRRFKLLSAGMPAKRLSTAFDSVTLYGNDPDLRPDIYGKVGNSGVSIATLDDLKVLYGGFDLTRPATSVSMTINGPAPTILAMFMNTAIDQNLDKFRADNGREPTDDEAQKIRAWTLANVRGTVQADILKEDQGQNTCIFSTEFSLKVMGDIAEWFVHHDVRNFYSVSISGYHIAEAGANPISQLAFTLSNGFTFVEAYLARGMHIDDFAPNLSFFFSNGMDPEYTVLGRVARRIWAVAMRDRYGANERSQKLKYHVQTSGRSLHAQEIQFNDIRTTLQALIAVYDNCNSLHTNAFDEAITTPTEDSVRRAMAIQLIINREWGLAKNENPSQGAFIIDELTELVEEAVLGEFERIAERGGVLGAMETGYQRGKIQEESMHYEMLKHTGEYPIIGVNTFRSPQGDALPQTIELARSTEEEKRSQLQRLHDFHARHAAAAPAQLQRLQQAVIDNRNVFAVLMDAVRVCSLGQITNALFEVGRAVPPQHVDLSGLGLARPDAAGAGCAGSGPHGSFVAGLAAVGARGVIAPGAFQLHELEFLDRAGLGATGLAGLGAGQAFHQPQVAVGQAQRGLGPQIDDGHQRFVAYRCRQALRAQRGQRAAQAGVDVAHHRVDGGVALAVVHHQVHQPEAMQFVGRVQAAGEDHLAGHREAGLADREVPSPHAGEEIEQDFGESGLRAALEDHLVEGQHRFQPAAERVALRQHGGVDAQVGGVLHPPDQVDAALAVELERVDVAGTHQQHEQRQVATEVEDARHVGGHHEVADQARVGADVGQHLLQLAHGGQAVALDGAHAGAHPQQAQVRGPLQADGLVGPAQQASHADGGGGGQGELRWLQ